MSYVQIIPLFTTADTRLFDYFRDHQRDLDALTGTSIVVALPETLQQGDSRDVYGAINSPRFPGLKHDDLPCLWIEDSASAFTVRLPNSQEDVVLLFRQLASARLNTSSAIELRDELKRVQRQALTSAPSRKIKVVFPLHGIRTRAPWQRAFADVAQVAKWNCRLEKWYFGWFSIFQFISPWARQAKVRWFRKNYYEEVNFRGLKLDQNQYPSIVAHSLGAYIVGNALLKYDHLYFDKVILCGSILPCDFPWDQIIERGQVQAVRNEYGVNDIWTKLVKWFIPKTGPSGAVGFLCRHDRFEQDEFRYDHSEYFDKGHMEAHWIPFLEKDISFLPPRMATVSDPKRNIPFAMYAVYLIVAIIVGFIFLNFGWIPSVAGIRFPNWGV